MNQAMQTKLQGVRRKDVAEDTAALREFQKTLTEGVDWWKEGVSTYWTPEAAARFHAPTLAPSLLVWMTWR